MSNRLVKIQVAGPFVLYGTGGAEIPISIRKEAAVLALLALSPGHRQSRKWIQSKLWSDRGEEQGAASLRQALSNLRRKLGPDQNILDVDRQYVSLNKTLIDIDIEAAPSAGSSQTELLQGIDINDQEFEEWLRLERQAWLDKTEVRSSAVSLNPQPKSFGLIFEEPSYLGTTSSVAGHCEVVIQELMQVSLMLGIKPRELDFGETPWTVNPGEILIRVKIVNIKNHPIVIVYAFDWMGNTLWTSREEINANVSHEFDAAVAKIGSDFFAKLINFENSFEGYSTEQISLATSVFTVLKGILLPYSVDIEVMQKHAKHVHEFGPSAIGQVIDGTVNVFVYGERIGSDRPDKDETLNQFRLALQKSPGNPLVNALAGHAISFFGKDPNNGLPFTKIAVKLAPGNPVCWMFYALSLGYSERFDDAYSAAIEAYRLSEGTIFRPFIESACCHAALMKGDAEAAIRFGGASLSIVPNFRPTMLDLLASYAISGKHERGREVLQSTLKTMPGLNLALLNDPSFPLVNSTHRQLVVSGANELGMPNN